MSGINDMNVVGEMNGVGDVNATSGSVYRKAKVLVQGRVAGEISEVEDGYRFVYFSEYLESEGAKAVSLTLPLQREAYTSTMLFPFFDGLIPEGWLLEVVRKHWGIAERDRFGVLLVACRDCIGDVQVVAEAYE